MARSLPQATNIPSELTSFVGRRRELIEVKRLLGNTRILTLTGTGGVGKTRLALRVASELARSFPDGIRLVELAALEDPLLLPNVFASGLGLKETSARWLVGALTEQLAGKRLLMMVDNCEHLSDPVAVLLGSLLRTCPALRVLATSRRPLRIEGETTFRVPSLSLPRQGEAVSVARSRQYEALNLFVQRASAASPGFQLTEQNVDTVAAICERLDGIPLGLELAAVRVRSLALSQILTGLDDRFQLLTDGSRASMPRHQTLRATLDWSSALLSEEAQALWRRLSVFVGGFDADAAIAVCGGGQSSIMPVLCTLVDTSILTVEAWNGGSRYVLSETLRQYGLERLAQAREEAAFRRRHRDWFRQLAGQAEAAWLVTDNVAWLARVQLEHGNFRTALESCLAEPDAATIGLEIVSALWMYWPARAQTREGRRWVEQLLALAPADTLPKARALITAGVLARVQGDYEPAAARLNEAFGLAERLGDRECQGLALAELAVVSAELGATERAIALLTRVRQLVGKPADRVHRSYVEYMASVLNWARQPYRAAELMAEALALSQSAGDRWRQAWALRGLGTAAWLQSDQSRAEQLVRVSLRLSRDLDDRRGIASCLETLACIQANSRPDCAASFLGSAATIWQSTGGAPSPSWQADREEARRVARYRLGGDRFDAHMEQGSRMRLEQMIALALEEQPPAETRSANGESSGLSPRELEIAQLVADGLSNKEIAARLLISVRTVDTHVDHILKKLSLRSRAQVAAWRAQF